MAALMLLGQAGGCGTPVSTGPVFTGPAGPAPEPRHMRYERAIALPAEAAGMACAVLDGAALAHAASRSGDDLRVFAVRDGAAAVETPFALTESEAAPGDAEPAVVQNLRLRDGAIMFDLAMPPRAYTTVDLQLAAKDFVGTAEVWGVQKASGTRAVAGGSSVAPGGSSVATGRSPVALGSSPVALGSSPVAPGSSPVALGSFTVFDLSGEGLARSTALPLQESSFAVLRVELRLRGMGTSSGSGKTAQDHAARFPAAIVQGAKVPPSREAQTLYTTVAATEAIRQQGNWSTAKFQVPAHVPIERVSFVLDPRFTGDFLREVSVGARPNVGDAIGADETVDGQIWRVTRTAEADGRAGIDAAKLSVDAVLGSNLRRAASVTAGVNNVVDHRILPPLPLREVQLEMRQRKICFSAQPGESYTLDYGDAALAAPGYSFAVEAGTAKPVVAWLGAERRNPGYVGRVEDRPYTERHPEFLWIALLVSSAVLGTMAIESVKRQGRRG